MKTFAMRMSLPGGAIRTAAAASVSGVLHHMTLCDSNMIACSSCSTTRHIARWASNKSVSAKQASAPSKRVVKAAGGSAVFPTAKRKTDKKGSVSGSDVGEADDDVVSDLDKIVEESITEVDSLAASQDDAGSIENNEEEPDDGAVVPAFTTRRNKMSASTDATEIEDEEATDAGDRPKGDDDIDVSSHATSTDGSDDAAQSKHLIVLHPNLAKQYSSENPIPLANLLVDNGAVVRWCCHECSHEWRQAVFLRCILKSPCPHCEAQKNPTMKMFPAASSILKEWDSDRNDPFVDPETLPVSSSHRAWWTCTTCRTSFEARVKSRVQGKAPCPTCSVTTLQSSRTSNDTIQLEWHPVKNGDLRLEQVPPSSKVWWLCSSCGHEWEASVGQRLRLKKTSNCSQCKRGASLQATAHM